MLVTHTPRQGVRVVELSREVLHEVCTIREALEGIAAREAAINITDEEAIELTGVIERHRRLLRSAEHTSELQSLMRISYAVFCLKKKTHHTSSYYHHSQPIHTKNKQHY